MNDLDRAIAGLRHRIRLVLWAKHAVWGAAAWGFLWGTAVLIGRVGLGLQPMPMTWGGIGLLPAGLLAWWIATRKTPGRAAVRAWLDQRSQAGGLVMAAGEADVTAWSHGLPGGAAPAPSLRWRGGRACLMLLAATAFVTTAFLVPHDTAAVSEQQRLNVENQAAELRTQIETLKDENLLDGETAEQMQQEVDDLAGNASARDPMKTFEALDHLARNLKRQAEQATERATSQAEQAAGMQAAAEAVQQAASQMSPEALREAMTEMADRAEQARAEGTLPNLDQQTLATLRELAERDPAALARMTEQAATQKELEKLTEQMAALGEQALARMDDAGEVTLFEPDNQTTADDLAGDMPNDDYAVRGIDGGEPAVFKSHFGQRVQLDPEVKQAVFGEGEKIVAIAGDTQLAVYQPAGDGEPSVLSKLTEQQAATINIAGAVALYEQDAQATQRANNAQQADGSEIDQAMRQLAEAAAAQGMNLKQRVKALANARMVDADKLRQLKQAGEIDRTALARMLDEAERHNLDGRTLSTMAQRAVGRPGRGGINRGRGDAPMTWKDPSSTGNTAFKEQTLPADRLDPRDSERIGVSIGAPDEQTGGASTGGQLRDAASDGGSVNRQRVLPRHRDAVEGYFRTGAGEP